MIAEKIETPVEQILKLEQDLARMQAEFQSVKEGLADVAAVIRRRVAFNKASQEVFTEYSDLLKKLSD